MGEIAYQAMYVYGFWYGASRYWSAVRFDPELDALFQLGDLEHPRVRQAWLFFIPIYGEMSWVIRSLWKS
jgi:hypothetical protein